MANYLKVSMKETISELLARGWSRRRVARELSVHRSTVARYAREFERVAAGTAVENVPAGPRVPTGSVGQDVPAGPRVPAGSGAEKVPAEPRVPAGFERSQSLCLAHAQVIGEMLELGLSAQRIWQDLVAGHGFVGGYDSVKRYVQALRSAAPMLFRRLECEAGAEAQLDFGQGAFVQETPDGRRRRPHVLRIVLSHSRKAYSEVVWRQDTESLIRVLENAFHHFGGVPRTLVPDNLKPAVLRAEWADPDLNPKLRDFCRHCGTVLLPTRVRTPRHKGKVERGIDYVQENALRGRVFASLAAQNAHLREWEAKVADTRIHGTTRQQVQAAFLREKPQLLPLPASLFPCFQEGPRKVHRDGHVEVAKSYYSVPPEYLRREVWVRWDSHMVRIFNARSFEQIRVHPRAEPGRFQTEPADIPDHRVAAVEKGEATLLRELYWQGDGVHAWARAMLQQRGIEGVRVLVGLLGLCRKHSRAAMNAACVEARKRCLWRLRDLRERLKADASSDPPPVQPDLGLAQTHDIIRPLSDYSRLIGPFTPDDRTAP